ncbi:hypothetical protein PbDSM24746_62520 [Paenibacillus macerans]|nr:hypothetical protein PbDSM24746_62520 [Paenibacillus macerans]GBK72605.1 hypothetical protein PbJCM17693_63130 [Paenibacillus macerans]
MIGLFKRAIHVLFICYDWTFKKRKISNAKIDIGSPSKMVMTSITKRLLKHFMIFFKQESPFLG